MSRMTEMVERFRKAKPILKDLIKDIEWTDNECDVKTLSQEELTYINYIRRLSCRSFDEAGWRLEAMFAPDVLVQGHLIKNSSGRFEIKGTEKYFTCGSSCEVYLPYYEHRDDDEEELMTWFPTSIEATNGQYYFTVRPDAPMLGALVRIRGYK